MQIARRSIKVTQPTYHRRKQQYRGMQAEEAKRLNQLERENSRLKKLLRTNQGNEHAELKKLLGELDLERVLIEADAPQTHKAFFGSPRSRGPTSS